MSKSYGALHALGDALQGGGKYLGVYSLEKLRSERLAQARAEDVADRDYKEAADRSKLLEQRGYDEEQRPMIAAEKVESAVDQSGQLLEQQHAFDADNVSFKQTIKGVNADGKDVFYKQHSDGTLEETDVGVSYSSDTLGSEYKDINTIRKEVNTEANRLGLLKSKESVSKMATAYQGENAMSDAAMIFYFMKTLDPISVVRESEFKTVQDARAFMADNPDSVLTERIPSSLKQFIQSYEGEGTLLQEQRNQMFDLSIDAYNSKVDEAKLITKTYDGIAQRRGYNRQDLGLERFDVTRVTRDELLGEGKATDSPVEATAPSIADDPAYQQALDLYND
jgi:hypothetical protein